MIPEWPGFDRPSIRLAEAYAACGSWREARAALESVELGDEAFVAAAFLLGLHSSRGGDWELALHHWGAASRQMEAGMGRTAASQMLLRTAIVNNLGVAHWILGDARSAQDCWVLVLAGQHVRPETMTNLGLMHQARGRSVEARLTLEVALRHAPGLAAALVDFAITLAIGGALVEAEQGFVRALSFADERAEPRKNLSNLYRLRGQEAEAMACWNRAMRDSEGPQVEVEGWTGMLALMEHPVRGYRRVHEPREEDLVYDLDASSDARVDDEDA